MFSQDCNVWLRSYDVATRSYAGYGDIVAAVIATATATATRKKSGYGYGQLRLREKNLATATVGYGYAKKIWLRLRYGYVAMPGPPVGQLRSVKRRAKQGGSLP